MEEELDKADGKQPTKAAKPQEGVYRLAGADGKEMEFHLSREVESSWRVVLRHYNFSHCGPNDEVGDFLALLVTLWQKNSLRPFHPERLQFPKEGDKGWVEWMQEEEPKKFKPKEVSNVLPMLTGTD